MAIDHRQPIVIIFRCNFTRWVGAKSPYLIVKRRRMVHQLCLIKVLIQELHHLIPDFHPDTNIHSPNFRFHALFFAHMAEPVCAFPANCTDNFIPIVLLSRACGYADCPAAFHKHTLYHSHKFHFHAVVQQMLLKAHIDLIAFLCAKVPNGAFHQLQVGINRLPADFTDFFLLAYPIDIGVRAEFKVDFIRFMD